MDSGDELAARVRRLGFLGEWTVTADVYGDDDAGIGLTHTCGTDPMTELDDRLTLAELVALAETHRCGGSRG